MHITELNSAFHFLWQTGCHLWLLTHKTPVVIISKLNLYSLLITSQWCKSYSWGLVWKWRQSKMQPRVVSQHEDRKAQHLCFKFQKHQKLKSKKSKTSTVENMSEKTFEELPTWCTNHKFCFKNQTPFITLHLQIKYWMKII